MNGCSARRTAHSPLPPEVQTTAAPKQITANPGTALTVGREVFRGTLKEVRR